MNLFQKQPKTSEYTSIPNASAADDEPAAVPLRTTRSDRSSTWSFIAIVAGMIMMLTAGGTIVLLEKNDAGHTMMSAAESVVVATETFVKRDRDCLSCELECEEGQCAYECAQECAQEYGKLPSREKELCEDECQHGECKQECRRDCRRQGCK